MAPSTEDDPSKADLRGLISDAQGVYHDLSKGAFDSFSMQFGQKTKDLTESLFNMPFAEGVQQILKKAGKSAKDYANIDLQGLGGKLINALPTIAKNAMTGGGVAVAAGKVAGYAGLELSTGGAATVGIVVDAAKIGVEWAIDHFKEKELDSYNRGDWLIIDEGEKTVTSIDREMDEGIGEMFEDMPTISELHTLYRMEDYHQGFYIGSGKEEASSTVFDLITEREREVFDLKIRKLPEEDRTKLDNDRVSSEIRELYFTKKDGILLDTEVLTDPGTEVLYKDEIWHIVFCSGDEAIIEADGGRKKVALVDLKRARQERVNGHSWQYDNGVAPDNDSFSTHPGGYGVGDWVWVQRAAFWELAMVHIISGDYAVVYMTQSGNRDFIPVDEVRVAIRDLSEMFNGTRNADAVATAK